MSPCPRCSECHEDLRSKAALDTGVCGSCFKALGAVPARKPGGAHDIFLCRCRRCNDRYTELGDDFREDYDLGLGDA